MLFYRIATVDTILKECEHLKAQAERLKSENAKKVNTECFTQADVDLLKQLNAEMTKTGKELAKIVDEFDSMSPDTRTSLGGLSFMEERLVVANHLLAQRLTEEVELNNRLRAIEASLKENDVEQ